MDSLDVTDETEVNTVDSEVETETVENPDTREEKVETFTQDDVDRIVGERLSRERQKHAKELEKFQKPAEDASSSDELKALQEQLKALQEENASAKLQVLRSSVSSAKGVPQELLTATTEEDLNAQADAILEFAKSSSAKAPSTPKENLKGGSASESGEMSRDEILNRVRGRR